jgi:hypothetical protein
MNDIVNEIRKAQQAKYNKEDNAILSAIEGLSLANAYIALQYNLDEENN